MQVSLVVCVFSQDETDMYQSGTVIKFDNLDQNNLLANQTSSLSSRDTSS